MRVNKMADDHGLPDGKENVSEMPIDWRTIFLASVGGGLEFYDFIVYGIFAPYVAKSFFPTGSGAMSMMLCGMIWP